MASIFCREEWRLRNFCFETKDTWTIISSQWTTFPKWLYIAWRIFIAAYHVAGSVLSGMETIFIYKRGQQTKWFIFLTNWQYALLTLSTLVQAIVVVYCHSKHCLIASGKMTWYLRLVWALDTMGNTVALTVGVMFWTCLYATGVYPVPDVIDINTHGSTLVYIAINSCISALPIRLHHWIYSTLFCVVYVVFTAIYYYAGGTNENDYTYIYPYIIDWQYTGISVLYSSAICFLFVPALHICLYGMYVVRLMVYSRMNVHREERINLLH